MSKLSKQIREYISCPELGDKHYGEWGILTLEQRQKIAQLCEEIDAADEYIKNNMLGVKDSADCLSNYILIKVKDYIKLKEQNDKLKHQLAEKDEEIEELKDKCEIWQKLLYEKMETQIVGVTNEKLKEIRHQVCEEIREFAKETYYEFGVFDEVDLEHILDKIEQGEKKC